MNEINQRKQMLFNKIIGNIDVMLEQHEQNKVFRSFVAIKDNKEKSYKNALTFSQATGIHTNKINRWLASEQDSKGCYLIKDVQGYTFRYDHIAVARKLN